jgi:hypothetical protein
MFFELIVNYERVRENIFFAQNQFFYFYGSKRSDTGIVIYEPSAGRRCSRMSAFFKARATKERVPLINARMNGRCLHASGSYNIFCTKIKLNFFFFNTLNINEHKTK